ncbi:sulfate permease [Myxococcus sp. CA056]|uniref:SulP family inorganic anion transporter n=1 Tax=unclassified Myxococcus TaxID=2648731 RepID=UPI00157A4B2B|nr:MULTISPECIES: sulfate permease [unclassified Myxococcus]NTX13889.1 sulfate permease [Myxococcus sp. CA056]NTX51059.1 sulfate permease [Myxococcus sp. CA039A]
MKLTATDGWRSARRFVPGLRWVRGYQKSWLRPDLLSALTIGAMLVPQGLAYAQIVGVRPVAGLYAGAIAMLAYALFGPSRHMLLGPEAGAAIIAASALAGVAGTDPARYASLAALLALMVGLISLAAGLFKTGALADFLSKPILIGYTNGAALIIIGSQLARMFGLERKANDFPGQVLEVGQNLGKTHLPTLLLGLGIIVVLVLLRRFLPKLPGPLILVVLTTVAAEVFQLHHGGVKVVGPVAAAPPSLGLPSVGFSDVRVLLPAALSLALVNYAGSVLTGRLYADKHRYHLDGNQEFLGQAAANLANAFTQGFPVTGSDSRTAVNDAMGGKSQLVGVVAAVLVTVFALFLTPLLKNLPLVTLGGIVIVAAVYLMDVAAVVALWRVRRVEAVLAVVTTLGVLVLGILQGILIAVALALGDLIRRAAHPHDAVLGEREGVPGWHDVSRHTGTHTIPGLLVYRFDAPMFFANARHLREQLRALVARAKPPVKEVVLDASAVFDLDVTAADGLEKLRRELEAQGIVLVIADANAPLRGMLRRTGMMERLGEENVYLTVEAAVARFQKRGPGTSPESEPPSPPASH